MFKIYIFRSMDYPFVETPLGRVWVVTTGEGLRALILDDGKGERPKAFQLLKMSEVNDQGLEARVYRDLLGYFQGEPVDFYYPLDLRGATDFQRAVWQTIRAIPPGQVKSYKWVAQRMGRSFSFRAVGRALAQNPLPIIIPCHRIVRVDGRLGGFSAGLEWKKGLLELEGVEVDSHRLKVSASHLTD